jgi:hypothetical protein
LLILLSNRRQILIIQVALSTFKAFSINLTAEL